MGNFPVMSTVLHQIWKNTPDHEPNLTNAAQQKRQAQYEFTCNDKNKLWDVFPVYLFDETFVELCFLACWICLYFVFC